MSRIKTVTDGTLNQPLTISDKIRDVDYLLSSGATGKFDHSSKGDSILLLGILVQLKEGGRHYLEDPTGAIPIDLSATISFENSFCNSKITKSVHILFKISMLVQFKT